MSFRFCLNTSTIKPVPLLEKVRLVAQAGYQGIEPWINDVYEYVGRGGEVRDLTRAVADHGLAVPCAIALRGWGDAVGEDYPVMLDECRRRMELAARLGSPLIVATPPRVPAAIELIAQRYGDLLEIGRQAGVRPVMEYISVFKSVHRLDQAWWIVQRQQHPDACLIADAFHTWNSNSDPELLTQVPPSKLVHYHIDDAPGTKPAGAQLDSDRVMPGDGVIDIPAEVRRLKQIGYSGWISLELFNRDLWAKNPADLLKSGLDRLREFFQ